MNNDRWRAQTRARAWHMGIAAMLLLCASTTLDAQGPRSSCDMCHGELEFLRQNTGTIVRARAALVPDSVLAGSAHAEMACTECHRSFGRFPHAKQGQTASCASCHEKADTAWQRGAHVKSADSEGASCAQCHGVHRVLPKQAFEEKSGVASMNRACIGCHQTERLHPDNPHADSTMCASCHGAHDVQPTTARHSRLAGLNQYETCGTCHDSIAAIWKQRDVHYRRVTCTDCHGAHGLNATADSLLEAAAVTRCGECHEDERRTFMNSYHGRATNLGSQASATCANCHGAHDIQPDSARLSKVAAANLVETCGECHEHARPGFVKYDSHPDPLNYKRNPWIFASFAFMNTILGMTLLVFGVHTLLWWWRLYIDKKRGVTHGHGDKV
jgi:predicted CXXCH cytochrome family protein